jgi:hypothetical protein
MSDLLQDTDLAREPVKEPALMWANKYWSELPVEFAEGHSRGPGVYWASGRFSTKRKAEDAAKSLLLHHRAWAELGGVEWLGAYPVEGERP